MRAMPLRIKMKQGIPHSGIPHQLFARVCKLWTMGIYHKLKKYFFKEHPNKMQLEFLTTESGL